ncbi:MAG TPA: flagellar export chaperone FlgN [Ideonella sp.]|uniref:flagellar export chaperone FlgN n=1 Tax=Ideonella sp. TaxID=1929293 RepID=UPI002CB533B1|nr:flagellar export chaperone FlgN [Ideonella sp.]HSI50160.1 flagellar export chaperone FlgN [Ideonella sp.]
MSHVQARANNSRQATALLLQDLRSDLQEARQLQVLLNLQFDALLKHDPRPLPALAADIVVCVERMHKRRTRRSALVARLVGPQAGMDEVLQGLGPSLQSTGTAWWKALEDLVRACKDANLRNCALLTQQHELMQRVLEPDSDLYAPA